MAKSKNIIEIVINAIDKSAPGLKKAGGNLKTFGQGAKDVGKKMAVAGGVVTGAFALIVNAQRKAGDEFQKTAIRTGISTETLSELGFAAEQAGADLGAVRLGLRRVAASAYDASQDLLEPKRNFEDLGVAFEDTNGKLRPTIDIVLDAADKFKDLEDATKASALAQKIFGRSGDLLLPLLKEGKEGILALTKESRELGRVWSQEDTNAAAELTDANNRLRSVMSGVQKEIFLALAPALITFADKMTAALKPIIAFTREHKGLIQAIAGGAVALLGAGGMIFALGQFAFAAGQLLIVVPKVTVALRGMALAQAGALGPIGLGIAAIAASIFLLNRAMKQNEERRQALLDEQAESILRTKTETEVLAELAEAQKRRSEYARSLNLNPASVPDAQIDELKRALEIIRERKAEEEKRTAELAKQTAEYEAQRAVTVSTEEEKAKNEAIIARRASLEAELAVLSQSNEQIRERLAREERLAAIDSARAEGRSFVDVPERIKEFDKENEAGLIPDLTPAKAEVEEFFLDVPALAQVAFQEAQRPVFDWANFTLDALLSVGDVLGQGLVNAIANPKSALKELGAAFKQLALGMLSQLASVIARAVVLKFILSALGFGGVTGGLLGLKEGGIVKAHSGGLVSGGVPGRDSVPALLEPGELVVPKSDVPLLRNLPKPLTVNVSPGIFIGDEGSKRELARFIEEGIRFNDTGRAF